MLAAGTLDGITVLEYIEGCVRASYGCVIRNWVLGGRDEEEGDRMKERLGGWGGVKVVGNLLCVR